MKKISELFGVTPGFSAKLSEAGIRTIADLASASDLTQLSRRTEIPTDLLEAWRGRAEVGTSKARMQRHRVIMFVAVILGLLAFITLWLGAEVPLLPKPARPAVLTWDPSSESSPGAPVIGYNVYRSATPGGPYIRIASVVKGLSFEDHDTSPGKTYFYVVSSVNARGMESRYSNEIRISPLG